MCLGALLWAVSLALRELPLPALASHAMGNSLLLALPPSLSCKDGIVQNSCQDCIMDRHFRDEHHENYHSSDGYGYPPIGVSCFDRKVEHLNKINQCNQDLLRAAREGDALRIWQALNAGAEVETRSMHMNFDSRRGKRNCQPESKLGLTPLMLSVDSGHLDCVHLLILARASVCSRDEDGMSPLHFAASSNWIDVAAALVWAGALPNDEDKAGVCVMGHLPAEVVEDRPQVDRWRATLGLVPAALYEIPAEGADAASREDSSKDKLHGVATAVFPAGAMPDNESLRPEGVDSLEYTRLALENMVQNQAERTGGSI